MAELLEQYWYILVVAIVLILFIVIISVYLTKKDVDKFAMRGGQFFVCLSNPEEPKFLVQFPEKTVPKEFELEKLTLFRFDTRIIPYVDEVSNKKQHKLVFTLSENRMPINSYDDSEAFFGTKLERLTIRIQDGDNITRLLERKENRFDRYLKDKINKDILSGNRVIVNKNIEDTYDSKEVFKDYYLEKVAYEFVVDVKELQDDMSFVVDLNMDYFSAKYIHKQMYYKKENELSLQNIKVDLHFDNLWKEK